MANSDNTQVNSSANQIDANNLYGLNPTINTGCLQGTCPPNSIDLGYYIPSLAEIASYNLSAPQVGNINPNSMQQNQSYDQTPQQMPSAVQKIPTQMPTGTQQMTAQMPTDAQQTPAQMPTGTQQTPASDEGLTIDEVITSQQLPQTPATVLNYGATMGSTVRQDLGMGITDYANPYPVTSESIRYLNGFIRTQIGRRVTIDFLVGSNNTVSKSGYLLGVAQDYILINELDTNDITTCDFYNIKFIRFYY